MEWWVFLLIAWVAVRFLGVGRCSSNWSHRRAMRVATYQDRDATLTAGPMRTAARAPVRPRPAAAPVPAETTEERLRRQYVDGTLSVEQYERELDAFYRGRA
jgi:hypothetical protein